MAKRVDPLKAKEAKQKRLAIGLCVLLVAVLAFQGPKTLKLLRGPEAAASTAAPASVGDPIGGAVVPSPAAGSAVNGTDQPAVLADSDVPAAAGYGQLRSFELFESKDPFVQQDVGDVTVAGSSAPPAQEPSAPAESRPAAGGSVIAPSVAVKDPDGEPTATAQSTAAAATSIAVNGVAADVAVDATFPAAAPAFVLDSLAEDGKSVQIGVAGGVYADGAATVKLTLGKPLTLENRADGTQYELELLAVAGFVAPEPRR